MLAAPFTPMLFMGEEWAAGTPWQYFTDHTDPELARAMAAGRRAEFAAFGWDPADVPDPQDQATFYRSKLDWAELDQAAHRDVLAWYTELIALRRAWPELTDPMLDQVRADYDESKRWLVLHRGRLRVVVNLGEHARRLPLGRPGTAVLAASRTGVTLDGRTLTCQRCAWPCSAPEPSAPNPRGGEAMQQRVEQVPAERAGTFDLSLWVPDSGSGPGLLLIQEIYGVSGYIRAVASDLAGLGYVVAAPDLFWRIKPRHEAAHDQAGLEESLAVGPAVRRGAGGPGLPHRAARASLHCPRRTAASG